VAALVAVAVQASQFYLPGVRSLVEDRLGIPILVLVFGTVLGWLALNVRHWSAVARVAAGIAPAGAC
jgi:hypothetical protein